MDYSLITQRLGQQLRQRRLNRGLTQAALASLACLTRQKVIAIEKGDLSVGMLAYAQKFDEAMAYLERTDALAGQRLNDESLMALRAAYLRGVLYVQQARVAQWLVKRNGKAHLSLAS